MNDIIIAQFSFERERFLEARYCDARSKNTILKAC